MAFIGAQTFFIDPSVVSGSTQINLTKVRLYFKAKPGPVVNQSGIVEPGATVIIARVVNGVPDISDLSSAPTARCEYNEILTSSDATVPTDFVFPDLDVLETGYEYAAIVSFDGDDDFMLWSSVQGDRLIGTTNSPSPGSSGQYVGKWFEYVTSVPGANATSIANSGIASAQVNTTPSTGVPTDYTQTNWRPLNSTDLKFTVYCARYAINGSANLTPIAAANTLVPQSAVIHYPTGNVYVSLANGTATYILPSARYEYVDFDYSRSHTAEFRTGEKAWQVRPYYPDSKDPTTCAVTANSNRITSSLDFSTLYPDGADEEYIVVVSLDHGGGATRHVVRKVNSVEADTGALILEDPMPWSNSAAYFYKAPVGYVDAIFPARIDGGRTNLLVLKDSNANSSVRFVNNSIVSISVGSGGTGYSNTDYVSVTGYENVASIVLGGYAANAALTTNSTGGIVSVHMANGGAGFVNTSAMIIAIANSTGGTSSGSGATLTANVGMIVASEHSYVPGVEGYVWGTELINPGVGDVFVGDPISNPLGTFLNSFMRLPYYKVASDSTLSGWAYHLDDDNADNDYFHIVPGTRSLYRFDKRRVLPSWSNELVITYAGSGLVSNGNGTAANSVSDIVTQSSNASVVTIVAASNNDFTVVKPGPISLVFSRYEVNDDYTGEEGAYGNASAKGLSKKVTFSSNTAAEDVKVWLAAWKPSGTNIKVYAKIHNSQDIEAFDDKDWTLLELESGQDLVSSQYDEEDRIELGYGFPQWPNTSLTLTGTVTTAASNTIVGSNTLFESELVVGDLIRVYSPLFSNTNYQVALVSGIASNTSLSIATPISNVDIIGTGMKVQKVGFKHQAFNNIMNDNVVRYYSSSMAEYDTFDTLQVKVVMLADDEDLVPKVDSIEVVGVSA